MSTASAPRARRTGAGILALILVVLGVLAVAAGRGWLSIPGVSEGSPGGGSGSGGLGGGGDVRQVSGVVGSEKLAYFRDPAVADVFADHGLEVSVEAAGSRKIATGVDLGAFDFAFPSSAPAAKRIAEAHPHEAETTPFHSPMAVATFQPIVDVLAAEGVAREEGGHWYIDMTEYLRLAEEGTRWRDLGDGAYPSPRTVQMSTTDARTSNSAAMYVSILSWAGNDGAVVADRGQVDDAVERIVPLLTGQGFTESSSAGPFADFLAQGMGSKPMVMIYESQFLERRMNADESIRDDMVLAYPDPTIQSKHTVIGLNSDGAEVARLLAEDPDLQRLAAEHGFRPQSRQLFDEVLADEGAPAPPELVSVIDPPSFDMLEALLTRLGEALGGRGEPNAAEEEAGAAADAPVGE